ncbi:MAG: hypothetical protein Q7T56_13290 [Nocardioidaceae bacterium]|nr:hypothetical protein [Nocardioidaceae bacterium]
MTDRDRPSDGPEHADVSALLAAEPEPAMPADVADRLQAALRAESTARGTAARPHRDVTPIGTARRRRVLPALAAAAAVVAVVAVGGTALVQRGGGSGADDSSAAGGAAESGGTTSAPEPGTLAQPDGGAADAEGRRLAEAQEAVDTGLAPPALDSAPTDLTCTGGQLDATNVLSVSYEGALGFLVTLPGSATTDREYAVFGCDGDTARRLAVLTPTG